MRIVSVDSTVKAKTTLDNWKKCCTLPMNHHVLVSIPTNMLAVLKQTVSQLLSNIEKTRVKSLVASFLENFHKADAKSLTVFVREEKVQFLINQKTSEVLSWQFITIWEFRWYNPLTICNAKNKVSYDLQRLLDLENSVALFKDTIFAYVDVLQK